MAEIKILDLPEFSGAPENPGYVELTQTGEGNITVRYPIRDILYQLPVRNLLHPTNFALTSSGAGTIFQDYGYIEVSETKKAIFTFTDATTKGFIPSDIRRLKVLVLDTGGSPYTISIVMKKNGASASSSDIAVDPSSGVFPVESSSLLLFVPVDLSAGDTMSIEVEADASNANYIIYGLFDNFL